MIRRLLERLGLLRRRPTYTAEVLEDSPLVYWRQGEVDEGWPYDRRA